MLRFTEHYLFGEMFLPPETLQVRFKMLEIHVAPCVHPTT